MSDATFGIVALVVMLGSIGFVIYRYRIERRHRIADDAAPISTAGPQIETAADRYIQGQLADKLMPGERISHQGYGTTRRLHRGGGGSVLGGLLAFASVASTKGVFVAITEERVYLIWTRVGAFAPLLENRGVDVIERARIVSATRDRSNGLLIELDDRRVITVYVDKHKTLSNQRVFLRDAARVLAK